MGIETAIIIAATAAAAASQVQAGMAASAESKSQENLARYNAQVQEREAQAIEQKTALEQRRAVEESERRRSTMLAGMGGAGVVTTSGTPLLVQAKQAAEDELGVSMIGYEGATQASRARSQGQIDLMEGKIARQRGKNQAMGSYIGAGSSVVSGFASGRDKGLW